MCGKILIHMDPPGSASFGVELKSANIFLLYGGAEVNIAIPAAAEYHILIFRLDDIGMNKVHVRFRRDSLQQGPGPAINAAR